MTKEKFNQMSVRIYAAFGKTAPAENNAISTLLYERVKFIGDEYCDKIAETLEGYEKFPANVGLAIISEYNSIAPAREFVKKECGQCHNDSGFFWFVHEQYSAPNGYSVRCPFCNGGNLNELNLQLAKGAKKVPNNKNASTFWQELFGDFSDKVAKDKAQGDTRGNTDTADNSPIAGHFKAGSQVVDNLDGISQVAGNFNPGSQVVDNLDDISQVAGNFNPGSQIVDNLDNLSQIVDNLGDALDDLWADA